jgi:hypothetical protein
VIHGNLEHLTVAQTSASPNPGPQGGQIPSSNVAIGLFVVTLPVLLVLGIVLRRRHRAAQLQRAIAHLERSWKRLPHNYRK